MGEFHDAKHSNRAIMGSAFILGISYVIFPLVAFAIINQNWQFEIPILNVIYKPWRLFIVASSSPGLLAAIALIFAPESPKFVLSQGNQSETIKIIEFMNRWNNGKDSKLGIVEIFEEADSIENRLRILETKQSRFPLLKAMWNQTAPLFTSPHLGPTLLICTLQFWTYYTSSG